MGDENSLINELQKENRKLKRKLELAEENLVRVRQVAAAQERVETILDNSLKKEFQYFQLVLENITNTLLLLDSDGRFAYASHTFLRDTGIAHLGLINGRHYEEVLRSIVREEQFFRINEALNAAISQKETITLEEQVHLKGEPRTFSISITPMFDEDAKHAGIMALLNDITDVLKAQGLAKQRTEAEAANKAKSAFLATMSHEIRTPMNAILGIAEIQLQNKALASDAEEAFGNIYSSANILMNIINDLLDLSKIEAGKLSLEPAQYDVASMLNDVIQLNMVRIDSKPIEFKVDVDENMPSVLLGDELRIKQILNNLLSNAFKYTAAGEVELKVFAEFNPEATLVINVKDTGQGMAPIQLDKLFDEYTRFNLDANRTVEGIGLGMSITKHLVKMMNGQISVESELGKGSLFTVRLPQENIGSAALGKEIVENLRKFRMNPDAYIKKTRIVRKQMPLARVLVVDDVEMNLYVAKRLLSPYGLSVDTARSGHEAIKKLMKSDAYDIVFMDHMMPGMDGIETTLQIKRMGYKSPIIALTANVVSGKKEMFLERGFNDFLSKPVNAAELNDLLEKWIPEEKQKQTDESALLEDKTQTTGEDFLIDGLDTRAGILMTGGALVSYISTLSIFYKDSLRKIEALRSYLSDGNLTLYGIHIHALKSTLASIGSKEMSKAAEALELAAQRNHLDFILINNDPFLDGLQTLLHNINAAISSKIEPVDLEVLKPELARLKTAMTDYDITAINEIAGKLQRFSQTAGAGDIVDKILQYKLTGGYDEAVLFIDEILNDGSVSG